MLLKKIVLNNIRSYKNAEITFTDGSVLLSGDIGSGKTSILLGVEFALFGLQPGQRGNFLLRNGAQEGGVVMEFEIDGREMIIERTLKKAKTISQDYCAITIDKEKTELSVTELKNKILELLNYPKEFAKKQNLLYKFTVYTPQEEMKQIILQDAETRINTLRHVFGIDKYKRILENSSVLASKIREEKKLKEGMTLNLEQNKLILIEREEELENKYYNLSSVEKEFFLKTEIRKKIEEEKETLSKKVSERNQLENEIEKTNIILLNKKEILSENERITKDIKEQITVLKELEFDKEKINFLEEELISRKKQKENINEKIMAVTSQMNSFNLKNEENTSLQKKISSLEICPTCLQDVGAAYRANILNKLHSDIAGNTNRIKELEKEKIELSLELQKINSEILSKEKNLGGLKILKIKLEGIQEKQLKIDEIGKTNFMIKKDIELLEKHLTLLRISVNELDKYKKIFGEKQKELEDALKEEKMVEIKIAELKKEIDVFSKQVENLRDEIIKTEEIKKQLDYLSKLEDWLSKKFVPLISYIEKNVMIKLKSEFSELFVKWFDMLVSDSFDARLTDDFTPVIEQQDYEIDYSYLSGGERTAVALAYRLALNQVINSFLSKIKTKDLVILDEPTDGFSEQQLDKMRDIFQQLNVGQLIIVSHEQKIESFVENVIRLEKREGVSEIEKSL